MKKFFNFGKIRQFADAVDEMNYINEKAGEPLHYMFFGTAKLHGTNAAVVITKGDYYAQSRTRVINPDSDNYGFAAWAHQPEVEAFLKSKATELSGDWQYADYVVVYGEWAGKGVQNSVAISQVPKFFAPFEVAVITEGEVLEALENDDDAKDGEVPAGVGHHHYGEKLNFFKNDELRIFPVTEEIRIPVNSKNLEAVSAKLETLTNAADAECPYAKEVFGITGPGEGYVWVCEHSHQGKIRRIRFKTKGEAHRVAKQKVAAPVDHELLENIEAFLEKYITEQRFAQGLQHLESNGLEPKLKNIGPLLKWLGEDILSEAGPEIEMLEEQKGIKWREIAKRIPPKVKAWL